MRQRIGTGVKWEARNASGLAAQATLENINVHEVRFPAESLKACICMILVRVLLMWLRFVEREANTTVAHT